MSDQPLSARVRAAYNRVKRFPEDRHNIEDGTVVVKGDAFIAFLDLRALMPDVEMALLKLERIEADEFIAIPRMDAPEA